MARADDPYAHTYTQLYAAVFAHFARTSGHPAKVIARAADCTDAYLTMITKGRRLPSLDKTQDLDHALGADGCLYEVRRLIDRLQAQHGTHGHNLGAEPQPSNQEDPVERRAALELLAALGVLGAETAIPARALEEVFAGIDHALGDRVDLDDWDRTVHEYGYLVSMRPVGSLITDLTADVIAVGRVLDRQHPPLVRAGLLRVSAGLSGLLATQFDDIGQRRAARISWGTARRAADASGDRDLSVWVRAKEANQARWTGRPDHIVADLADEAIELADGAPSVGLARAHATRACLSAGRGDAHTARSALISVSEVTDHTISSMPRPWREQNLRWNEAYVYTLVGDDRAAPALDRALALYPPGTLNAVANLHLIRAVGLVRNREVDEGLEHAVTTLQGGPVCATRRHLTGEILKALPEDKARSLPAARELRALTGG